MLNFLKAVASLLFGKDPFLYVNDEYVGICRRNYAASAFNADLTEREKLQLKRRLLGSLIRSKNPEEVQLGINELEATLNILSCEQQELEDCYYLAVGYYRKGNFERSMIYINRCLKGNDSFPGSKDQTQLLKKAIENKYHIKRFLIHSAIVATAVAVGTGLGWMKPRLAAWKK